jgi:hypothetical protein
MYRGWNPEDDDLDDEEKRIIEHIWH